MSSAAGAAQNQLVLLTVEGGVATLAFNRPQILNAMDADMMIQFRAAAELVERDPAVRVILLRGEGAAFLAGGDVALFHQRLRDLPDIIVRWGREMHFAIQALRRSPKPVLASVHGACAGAGFSILWAADLAVAADNAHFRSPTARSAPVRTAAAPFSCRVWWARRALELMLLSDTFDAQTARELGLVNWVVPGAEQLEAETEDIAGRLASGPTRRLRRDQAAGQPVASTARSERSSRPRCAGVRALRGDTRTSPKA